MLRTFVAAVVLSSIVLSSCRPAPKPTLSETFKQLNAEINSNFEAYTNLEEATRTIGHRLTGTENGRRAEEFTHRLFKKYKMNNVRFQEFAVEAWMRQSVQLEIVPVNSDNFITFPAVTLAHSPLKVNLEGEIIDAGNGLASDFEALGDKVRGKVVLMNIGISPPNPNLQNLHRSEKCALAIRYGAGGVIMVNQVQGNVLLTGTASIDGSLIPIPAVSVSLESGRQIRHWLREEQLQANIEMVNTSEQVKARNVIAQIRGSELPNEKIVIGGHLDSWDLATGAIDNGIGSFTVIEVARALRSLKYRPKRTIEFVMFMGEEIGLKGSEALVAEYKAQNKLNQVKFMVNLDMAGNATGFNAMGRNESKIFFEEIGKLIQSVDPAFQNKINNTPGLHSDHQNFMLEGIPVAAPVSNLDPKVYSCYHASCDNFNLVNREHMLVTARYTAMLIYALAEVERIPSRRMTSEETRDFLIENNLKEKLQIGGDWRW